MFKTDKTYTLILRLRQNVIRMGLRKINVAYSCISFQDIADKLHLESAEVAEGVVAKVCSTIMFVITLYCGLNRKKTLC